MEDPWVHRSKEMSCSTCMWFVLKAPGQLGRCRRHAPTLAGYPVVFPTDWCGDHKLDEHKLERDLPAQPTPPTQYGKVVPE